MEEVAASGRAARGDLGLVRSFIAPVYLKVLISGLMPNSPLSELLRTWI